MRLAAVLGGATGGLDELTVLRTIAPVAGLFAVNDAAAEYPGHVDAFVTLHPEKLPHWLAKRITPPGDVVSIMKDPGVTRITPYQWPEMTGSGSSGLYAVKVALEAGFDRVVLCGVPMEFERAHYFDPKPWADVDQFWPSWEICLPRLKDCVRSMSGRTATLLGMPNREFLSAC